MTDLYRGKPMYDMFEEEFENSGMYRHLMRDCRDFGAAEDDCEGA